MRLEDLGIAGFRPVPSPQSVPAPPPPAPVCAPVPPNEAELAAAAALAAERLAEAKLDRADMMGMAETASTVSRQNLELMGFLSRAQAVGQTLGVENALLRRALAAARLHRALLFGALILVLLLARR